MSLDTSEWEVFYISRNNGRPGLFDIESCKCGNAGALEEGNDIKYIGAKKADNGVMRSVAINPRLVSKGHGIMFICDGEGSVGYTNYIDKDFIGSTTTSIGYDEHLTPLNALFLVALLDLEKYKFSYGRKYRVHLNEIYIKLPIQRDSEGAPIIDADHKYAASGYLPDWDFVESYMKTLHHKPLTTKNKKEDVLPLHPASWKKFRVGDLFYIRRGDRIVRNVDYCDNPSDAYKYPVITTTTTDNGIDGWYTQANCDGNCLVSGGEANGMFTTYQENPFWGLDTIRIYSPKGFIMNKYIALFLAAIFSQDMYRFSYGRKAKPDNMYSLNIKLPVTSIGDPDWQFMEDYIKSLPYGDRI